MAAAPYKSPAGLFAVALTASLVSLAGSSAPLQSRQSSGQVCADGVYDHNGRICCLCAAGQLLVKNCITEPLDRECNFCEKGTYNSEPNHETSCKPCASCEQPDANLEVDEPCTLARNTKCKCKVDHYCSSRSLDADTCLLCHPCKVCGNEGIKSACTATHNTVCHDENEVRNHTTTILSVISGVLLVAAALGCVLLLKRRRSRAGNPNPPEEEVLLADLKPHLPEIADTLGWRVVERLAIRSKMKSGVIESCKLNHPSDNQTQTLQLLENWMEMQGRDASKKLIKMLNDGDMKHKADEVKAILSRGRTNTSI